MSTTLSINLQIASLVMELGRYCSRNGYCEYSLPVDGELITVWHPVQSGSPDHPWHKLVYLSIPSLGDGEQLEHAH